MFPKFKPSIAPVSVIILAKPPYPEDSAAEGNLSAEFRLFRRRLRCAALPAFLERLCDFADHACKAASSP